MFFYREVQAPQPPEPQIVTDGLILHLDAQNTSSYSGTGSIWEDLTEYNNDGTIYNGAAYATTEYNQKVFNFDGSNDYIELPSNFFSQNANSDFSLSVWFKTTFAGGIILGQSNAPLNGGASGWVPAIYIDNAGKVKTSCFWGGAVDPATTSNALNDGDWHNISYTYSSGSRKTYVDGVLDNTKNLSQTSYSSVYYYFLGAGLGGWPDTVSNYFSGSISNFLFYTKTLTDSEVLQNFNALKNRYSVLITGYTSGSSVFTTPSLSDSFEFNGNWNDAVDLPTATSGTVIFTVPDLSDSFETDGGW
jgi:hypothetical protein